MILEKSARVSGAQKCSVSILFFFFFQKIDPPYNVENGMVKKVDQTKLTEIFAIIFNPLVRNRRHPREARDPPWPS